MTTTLDAQTKAAPLYHVGLRTDHSEDRLPCPFWYVTLGGVTFHRYTERVSGYGPDTKRVPVAGGYVRLTPDKLAAIEKDLKRTRIQFLARDPESGKPKVYVDDSFEPPRRYVRARLVKHGTAGYIPQADDRELHGWIYMQEHHGPTQYEEVEPLSLLSKAAGAQPDEAHEISDSMTQDKRKGLPKR